MSANVYRFPVKSSVIKVVDNTSVENCDFAAYSVFKAALEAGIYSNLFSDHWVTSCWRTTSKNHITGKAIDVQCSINKDLRDGLPADTHEFGGLISSAVLAWLGWLFSCDDPNSAPEVHQNNAQSRNRDRYHLHWQLNKSPRSTQTAYDPETRVFTYTLRGPQDGYRKGTIQTITIPEKMVDAVTTYLETSASKIHKLETALLSLDDSPITTVPTEDSIVDAVVESQVEVNHTAKLAVSKAPARKAALTKQKNRKVKGRRPQATASLINLIYRD